MVTPVRLQLSRRKGFDLQKLSLAINGLPAVKVCRPGPWGNPFVVTEKVRAGAITGGFYFAVPTVEDAVECFREMLAFAEGAHADWLRAHLHELHGKNLACWCKPGEPCHADVLLDLARTL